MVLACAVETYPLNSNYAYHTYPLTLLVLALRTRVRARATLRLQSLGIRPRGLVSVG
ncbi:MAG TPA: hypothetical protein V6D37_11420 [Candidatus Sericytochromatia bacterium]